MEDILVIRQHSIIALNVVNNYDMLLPYTKAYVSSNSCVDGIA